MVYPGKPSRGCLSCKAAHVKVDDCQVIPQSSHSGFDSVMKLVQHVRDASGEKWPARGIEMPSTW